MLRKVQTSSSYSSSKKGKKTSLTESSWPSALKGFIILLLFLFSFLILFKYEHKNHFIERWVHNSLPKEKIILQPALISTPTEVTVSDKSQGTLTKPTEEIVKSVDKEESLEEENVDSQKFEVDSAAEQTHVIQQIEISLKAHPFNQLTTEQINNFQMEDYFIFLSSQPSCQNLPVITSMANIFSELYWQLIENFFYSMVKFGLSSCSLMICVSDVQCMERCKKSFFPCILFDFQKVHPNTPLPSALEQIAELKLLHLPKALAKGVNIMILDSDVGFLSDPMNLIRLIDPKVDMYVQKDIAYVMNRTLEGWKTWYTVPLPNIGIFYIRGNERNVRVFEIAWQRYQDVDVKRRNNPGKDQNQFAIAMKMSPIRWSYFPTSSAVLLDMVYKFNDPRYELGGEAALSILQPSNKTNAMSKRHKMGDRTKDVGQVWDMVHAVHTTCYEQKNKVNGLKTTNAFWNPYYYSVTRPTITKKILYISDEQVRNEIRTLLYLGYISNRSVIIPNIFSAPKVMHNPLDFYEGRSLWPWFRIMFYKKSLKLPNPLNIIEPSYYWRIERDYFMNKGDLIPKPYQLKFFNTLNKKNYNLQRISQGISTGYQRTFLDIKEIEEKLLSSAVQKKPRVVLDILPYIYRQDTANLQSLYHLNLEWALDSVGKFRPFEQEFEDYELLPKLNGAQSYQAKNFNCNGCQDPSAASQIVKQTRLCDILFRFDNGNRSCFNKCH